MSRLLGMFWLLFHGLSRACADQSGACLRRAAPLCEQLPSREPTTGLRSCRNRGADPGAANSANAAPPGPARPPIFKPRQRASHNMEAAKAQKSARVRLLLRACAQAQEHRHICVQPRGGLGKEDRKGALWQERRRASDRRRGGGFTPSERSRKCPFTSRPAGGSG